MRSMAGASRASSVFFLPRRTDGSDPVRMANHQLTRYAGFRSADGNIVGDPHSVRIDRSMLGHRMEAQERTPFTPLPWQFIIEGKQTSIQDVFEKHEPGLFQEVKLTHPEVAGILLP
jgi:nitric-oxide synthase